MVSLATIEEKLLIAQAYYIELLSAEITSLQNGRCSSNYGKLTCLNRLIRALEWDVADEVNDDATQSIYELLLNTISLYNGDTLSVDTDVIIPFLILSEGLTEAEVQALIDASLEDYQKLPDRILTGLEISKNDNDISISSGTWSINTLPYSKGVATEFNNIPLSESGKNRFIVFYANNLNQVLKIEGDEATSADFPNIPDNSIQIGWILVGDAGIGNPVASLAGYVKLDVLNTGDINITGDFYKNGIPLSTSVGTVTSVSGTNSTGITFNITNPTTTPGISLSLTKSAVGLANVDNTSDTNKPVSTAQEIAISVVQDDIDAHEARVDNPHSVTKSQVGLGNVDNTSDLGKPISTASQTALDLKAPLASPTFTGTVSGITKSMVGLGNVDNTTDLNKPVSTATQTALDLKSDKEISINTQTGSYTLVIGDSGKLIRMNVASSNNLTVPPNGSVAFPIGTQLILTQLGAGQTTVVAGSGVTINSSGGKLKLTGQYSAASLIKTGTDTWLLAGDIET